ncbi:flagella basal body P-ring formation protein FlgA [Sphingomonas ginkgonis]|uniref:flagella basal body P-ring formation protein FlgA n=1 Tax=Sphingomonas ginkgonis TaxID=2315330 RepID=UPI00163AE62A|nr:flagella basal body P-ring formation protein FlgA [Sphingomonas ginkgonis]
MPTGKAATGAAPLLRIAAGIILAPFGPIHDEDPMTTRPITAALLLLLPAPALAAGFQDLDALDARIAASLTGSASATPIDRRIRLAACPQDPEIAPAAGGALTVRCAALGWRIRVMVTGAASPAAIAPATLLVHRGDAIELVARGSGYSASAVGTAVDEGGAGASIRVKFPTSPMPLTAVVAKAGQAVIGD